MYQCECLICKCIFDGQSTDQFCEKCNSRRSLCIHCNEETILIWDVKSLKYIKCYKCKRIFNKPGPVYTKEFLLDIIRNRVCGGPCDCDCPITRDGIIKVAMLVNKVWSSVDYSRFDKHVIGLWKFMMDKRECFVGNRVAVAAALIYAIRIMTNERLTQSDIAYQCNTSEATVRKYVNAITAYVKAYSLYVARGGT